MQAKLHTQLLDRVKVAVHLNAKFFYYLLLTMLFKTHLCCNLFYVKKNKLFYPYFDYDKYHIT